MDFSCTLVCLVFYDMNNGIAYVLIDSSNNGQMCVAGSRIFVQARIYDEFLAKLTERAKSLILGDPFAKGTTQGPLVSETHFEASLFTILLWYN